MKQKIIQLATSWKGEKEKDVYKKYKDRHISCTYILDNTRQGYNTVPNKNTLNIDKTLNST